MTIMQGVWYGFWSAAAFFFSSTAIGFQMFSDICKNIAGDKDEDRPI